MHFRSGKTDLGDFHLPLLQPFAPKLKSRAGFILSASVSCIILGKAVFFIISICQFLVSAQLREHSVRIPGNQIVSDQLF